MTHSSPSVTRKKILVLFGTRPELIKLAPVIRALKARDSVETIACSTGQHREMLRQVMEIFDIRLDVDLDLMKPNQDLFELSATVLVALRQVFTSLAPDMIVVQGDTTTAFIASLAAYYLNIKVAHVEAGLRSYNIKSPFPEEANRRFISVVSEYNFAPTSMAENALLREGCAPERVWVTGNTVVDALEIIKTRLDEPCVATEVRQSFKGILDEDVFAHPYVLITLHRREKFGAAMQNVLETIKALALKHPELRFVYPLHLNPNILQPAKTMLEGLANMHLIQPQDYVRFNYLMAHCRFIVTDSGGIQEEAFTYRKPVVVLRDVTERMEAIEAGYAFLVGHDASTISTTFEQVNQALLAGHDYFTMSNPYGDGKASERIAEVLIRSLTTGHK